MPAFNENHHTLLLLALGTMWEHHRKFLRCPLTHEDFLRLVVHPQDHDTVKRAAVLFESYTYYGSAQAAIKIPVDNVPVEVSLTQVSPLSFIMPKYAKSLLDSAPTDAIDKLTGYLREYIELARQYGRVREVLQQLSDRCETPSQVKFLWPAVGLIAERIKDDDARKRLQTKLSSVSRKSLPIIAPGLRAACREASATLAMWQMLPASPPDSKDTVIARATPLKWLDGLGEYSGM